MPNEMPSAAPEIAGDAAPPMDLAPLLGGQTAANPQPAAPQRETLKQGFVRGARGETYMVDNNGNTTNARTTSGSGRGVFGSVLASAALGALAGLKGSRPGGVPSAELGGGVSGGMKASDEFFQNRDLQARSRAQGDFANRVVADKSRNEDLEAQADIHIKSLQAIQLSHEIAKSQADDPILHQQLVNATIASQTEYEVHARDLGLVNERTYSDYHSIPKADIDKFNRHQLKVISATDGSEVSDLGSFRGAVKVWDRTFDPKTTPNSSDFETRSLVSLDPKTGKPEWKVTGHVKAGSGTVAQQEAQLDYEREQLTAMGKQNADILKSNAEAEKLHEEALLTKAETANLKNMGVTVPPGLKTPADAFHMDSGTLRSSLVNQGMTLPPDFESLYAVGHYKAGLDTFVKQIRAKGGSGMTQDNALTFIKTFINPGFDISNFAAVKELELDYAKTAPNTAGGNLINFNTATAHIGQLLDADQQLKNGNLPAANAILQGLGYQTGKAAPVVFDTIKTALSGELGKTYKGGVPDKDEVKDIKAGLDVALAPGQLQGAAQAAAKLMLSKAGELVRHYYDLTGELPKQTIDPQAMRVYQRLGIDANDIFPDGAKAPVGGSGGQQQNVVPPGSFAILRDGKPIGYYTLPPGGKLEGGVIPPGTKRTDF